MRLLSLLLLSCAVFAQELALRPTLQSGDVFELELVRSREDSRRPQLNGSSRTPVQVRVLEAGPNGFVLAWRPGATSFDNPEIVKNPVAALAANALKDTPLEIVLDPGGKFSGLRNQAAVTTKLLALRDESFARYSAGLDDPQRKQAVANIVQRLLAPEALLSAAAADVQTYFSLHGSKLTRAKPVETAIQQPSPQGSGTIAATYRVTLELLDAHEAKIATITTYPKQPALKLADSGYYVYNRAFGIMSDVVIVRSAAGADSFSRKDTSEIRLVTKPAR
ncbi:MAG: hypothetical protein ABI972_25360 [Acidobacteriota bacterium]